MEFFKGFMFLAFRDLISSIDRHVLIYDISFFPLVFIFIGGYSLMNLFSGQSVSIGDVSIPYPAYLASGWLAVTATTVGVLTGAVIWNDRRNGMFEQILGMPFTRSQYILGNLTTTILVSLLAGGIIGAIGFPTLIGHAHLTLLGIFYILFAIITCSLIFGSAIIMAATRMKNRIGFTILVNLLAVYSQSSSAFYPIENVPPQIQFLYNINPVSYAVDIIRIGLFYESPYFNGVSIGVLATVSVAILILGMLSIKKLNV